LTAFNKDFLYNIPQNASKCSGGERSLTYASLPVHNLTGSFPHTHPPLTLTCAHKCFSVSGIQEGTPGSEHNVSLTFQEAQDIKIQFVLHRRHFTSPLQCPAGEWYVRFKVFAAVTMKNVFFWVIKTQFILHRRHITSPLQSPAS
jgi:hypothetical protein